MSITVLYDFEFEGGSITEVKFENLTSNARKSERYQWYLCYNNHRYNLGYIEMIDNTRKLFHKDVGVIEFDPATGKLVFIDYVKTLQSHEL